MMPPEDVPADSGTAGRGIGSAERAAPAAVVPGRVVRLDVGLRGGSGLAGEARASARLASARDASGSVARRFNAW